MVESLGGVGQFVWPGLDRREAPARGKRVGFAASTGIAAAGSSRLIVALDGPRDGPANQPLDLGLTGDG